MLTPFYLDDDLAAFAKPPGIPTIPERRPGTDSLLKSAESALNQKLYIVHRLDKEASGVVLFARHAAAHRFLNTQFAAREVAKKYQLLVLGVVTPDEGRITAPIRQFGSGRMGIDGKNGKPSQTDFVVLQRYAGVTRLHAFPHTGRRHQLRVHFYSIGHPIAGDTRYGDPALQSAWPRLMLHAEAIEIRTPAGKSLNLTDPPPISFRAVVEALDSHLQ